MIDTDNWGSFLFKFLGL